MFTSAEPVIIIIIIFIKQWRRGWLQSPALKQIKTLIKLQALAVKNHAPMNVSSVVRYFMNTKN
jgi:hypothetical protein